MNTSYKDLFAGNINVSIMTATSILTSYPASAGAFIRIAKGLKDSENKRMKLADHVQIPPLMIVSTTEDCNLACTGCYSCAHNRKKSEELSTERIIGVLNEASELGVSIVMLAGGEPLLSSGWIDTLGTHDEMVGIVFTNGTLFDKNRIEWLSAHRHIIPALSIEGNKTKTDARRGKGVYDKVKEAMCNLHTAGIPFGVSITITSNNIDDVLNDSFTNEYISKGCLLFIYVEYVPIEPGSEPMVLSNADKKRLSEFTRKSEKKHRALFIPFPGDEDQYGGCLAAGRGFIHISSNGNIEPCPFAPFSDTNLQNTSLENALASEFLSKVRENHHLLKEGDGGCALWHNREWFNELTN